MGIIACMVYILMCKLKSSLGTPINDTTTAEPLITSTSPSGGRRASFFPDPRIQLEECGRNGKPSFICDPTHLLNETEANELDERISQICDITTCPCTEGCPAYCDGYNIRIALISHIIPSNFTVTEEYQRQEWLSDLRRHWIQSHSCPIDVIILYTQNNQKIWTGEESTINYGGNCERTDISITLTSNHTQLYTALTQVLHKYRWLFINTKRGCKEYLYPLGLLIIPTFIIFVCTAAGCYQLYAFIKNKCIQKTGSKEGEKGVDGVREQEHEHKVNEQGQMSDPTQSESK